MTKNQTIDLLRSQLPGFYSVEQVINLIDKIEEEKVQSAPKLTLDQLRDLTQSIVNAIEEEAQRDNVVCYDDVEFLSCGNCEFYCSPCGAESAVTESRDG